MKLTKRERAIIGAILSGTMLDVVDRELERLRDKGAIDWSRHITIAGKSMEFEDSFEVLPAGLAALAEHRT